MTDFVSILDALKKSAEVAIRGVDDKVRDRMLVEIRANFDAQNIARLEKAGRDELQIRTVAPAVRYEMVYRHDDADFDPNIELDKGMFGKQYKDWVYFNNEFGITRSGAKGNKKVWRYEIKSDRLKVEATPGKTNMERRVQAPLTRHDVLTVTDVTGGEE